MQYAEEPKEAQRTLDDCGTAVENLCMIPAKLQQSREKG